MPEGPEVKTITDELVKILSSKTLNKVEILGGRYKTNGAPQNYDLFLESLPMKITSINCKGKFIWFELENEWSIWNHLGMAAGWKLDKVKHSDVQFDFDDLTIWFTDQRHFGTLTFCNKNTELKKKLKSLGPDLLLENSLTENDFIDIIRKHPQKCLPKILMDQKNFSGIGNYLKSEILYASKISPLRKIVDINDDELKLILKNTQEIMMNSYKAKGATIRNYSDLSDNKGEYSFSFKVYNRKKDDLDNEVIKTNTNDNRTTHWVPSIQK